jgi:hypothetical protein
MRRDMDQPASAFKSSQAGSISEIGAPQSPALARAGPLAMLGFELTDQKGGIRVTAFRRG